VPLCDSCNIYEVMCNYFINQTMNLAWYKQSENKNHKNE
jgi:hypothetical protein